ncbi:trypsin-like serine peptidase [Pseudooctadecabacter jejudonensis]|uniref:Serine protease n=1 Tax=Pseudooctadecabacter jejudonensis TaxID=1391910 RepID=A0A1Y5TDP7_9RHOB|nr:trypsin-like serine protease [Pseudooctadecabacter jejudonensis]SLN61689.1 Glutamyl endopeptidase precursor [Pseudooctadecabacter jejudonensis]
MAAKSTKTTKSTKGQSKAKSKTKAKEDDCGCGCSGGVESAPTVAASDIEMMEDFINSGPQDEFAESDTWASDEMVENGLDVETHGGGSLEYAEGFELFDPMVRGLGETMPVGLPEGYDHIPMACSAHFDDAPMESVCGHDGRVQVGENGTPPWRMICQLIITMANGTRSRGTGWFISPRTVMTAGHCVHSKRNGGWATKIEVIPGMSGTRRPFGSAISTQFHSVSGWVNDHRPADDYACIVLPETAPLGRQTGWFGFAALSDASLKDLLANNSGYPGDKTFGTQWYNAGRIVGTEPQRLAYMFDTAPGQSGSPTWRYDKTRKRRHVIGIHNYGGCANRSTRINRAVFNTMKTWKQLGQ